LLLRAEERRNVLNPCSSFPAPDFGAFQRFSALLCPPLIGSSPPSGAEPPAPSLASVTGKVCRVEWGQTRSNEGMN
jgi:hypothetical protein